MLIEGGDCGSGGSSEDVGKLTRKRLNRGLPGRKQGTVRIQVAICPCTTPLDSKPRRP